MTPSQAAERAGLVADVIAHPGDDAPRLIFADWLEDQGDGARAEFVRVQCELCRLDAAGHTPDPWHAHPRKDCPEQFTPDGCAGCSRMIFLRRRERDLFAVAADAAMFAGGPLWDGWQPRPISGHSPNTLHFGEPLSDPPAFLFTFRRGFVEEIACTLEDWKGYGPAIVRAHPLSRVELSDREPAGIDGAYGWWDESKERHAGERDELPGLLWSLLEGGFQDQDDAGWKWYASFAAAISAASAALLLWAETVPPAPPAEDPKKHAKPRTTAR